MIEGLKKYRKLRKLSKKQMAELLEISKEQYKDIESNKEAVISDELAQKINKLLSSKTASIKPKKLVGLENLDKLNGNLKPFEHIQDKINSIPAFNNSIINLINDPIIKALEPTKSMGQLKSSMPTFTIPETLNALITPKTNNYIWESIVNPLRDVSSINAIIESQKKVQDIFSVNSIFNSSNDILKTLEDINKPFKDFNILTETILENQKPFDNYLDFNSKFTSNLIGSSALDSYFSKENFLDKDKPLSAIDIISGTTFSGHMEFFNEFQKEEEKEIINEIENNPEARNEALEFLSELAEIVEEGEKVNEEKLEAIYLRVTKWIEKWFKSINKKALAGKVFIMLIPMAITLSFARYGMIKNSEGQNELSNQIDKIQDDLNETKNNLIKPSFEKLEKLNLKAVMDINLRRGRNIKSKSLLVIQKGEVVSVIDMKRKWMKVSYTDLNNDISVEGWVKMGYFEKVKK